MSVLSGMLLGFVLALPPGGVVLVGLNLALRKGGRRASPYAVGVMLVDSTYAFLAIIGAQGLLEGYGAVTRSAPGVMIAVQGLIVFGLVGYGLLLTFRDTPILKRTAEGDFSVSTRAGFRFLRAPLSMGFGMSLSNLWSPTFLVALAIVATHAHSAGVDAGNHMAALLYASGYGLGGALYLLIAMRLVDRWTRNLNDRHFLWIQRAAGLAFAVLGLVLMIQVLRP